MSDIIIDSNKSSENKTSQTFRKNIKIPPLPKNTEELKNLPSFKMHKSRIVDNELCFERDSDFDDVCFTIEGEISTESTLE